MHGSRVFRDRRTAASAVATTALLCALELADASAPTGPDDEIHDKRTIEVFGAAIVVAAIGACSSLVRSRPVPRRSIAWWSGLGLIWAGASVNRTARRQLGSAYRSRVTVMADHQVVRTGLYRKIRHPMYSGTVLICGGAAMAVDSPAASSLWILPLLALVRRIQVEETALRDALGPEYANYATQRARLVPGIW